jgi:hypothetical protein
MSLLRDAHEHQYGLSAWREGLAAPSQETLKRSPADWERRIAQVLPLADAADTAVGAGFLPFNSDEPLSDQAEARRALATRLEPLVGWDRPHFLARVAGARPVELEALVRQRETLNDSAQILTGQGLDPDLWERLRGEVPALLVVAAELRRLNGPPVRTWPWANRGAPGSLTRQLGLKVTGPDRERAKTFLQGLYHRLMLEQMVNAWLHSGKSEGLDDIRLRQDWEGTGTALGVAKFLESDAMGYLREPALAALREPGQLPEFIANLRRSADGVRSGAEFEARVDELGVFSPEQLQKWRDEWNRGHLRRPLVARWLEQHLLLPSILEFERAVAEMPLGIREHLRWFAGRAAGAEVGWLTLRRAATGAELLRRRSQHPELQSFTGNSLQSALTELNELVRRRRRQVYGQIERRWVNTLSRPATPIASATPEDLLSGRALVLQRPLWVTTSSQALELFAPSRLFDLLVIVSDVDDRLAEVLPTLLRAGRAMVVATTEALAEASQAAAVGQTGEDENGPGFLEVISSLGVPAFPASGADPEREAASAGSSLSPANTHWSPHLPPTPLSQVHPSTDSTRPVRTPAALGAVLRNLFDVSTEVHAPDTAGPIDLVVRHLANSSDHRAGWLVDLPDWTTSEVPTPTGEAQRQAALEAASWQITRVWTPYLLPELLPELTQLLAHSGVIAHARSAPSF